MIKSVDRKPTAGMTVADVHTALCAAPAAPPPADGGGELLLGLSRATPEGRVQQFWVSSRPCRANQT